mgnify:CR=1
MGTIQFTERAKALICFCFWQTLVRKYLAFWSFPPFRIRVNREDVIKAQAKAQRRCPTSSSHPTGLCTPRSGAEATVTTMSEAARRNCWRTAGGNVLRVESRIVTRDVESYCLHGVECWQMPIYYYYYFVKASTGGTFTGASFLFLCGPTSHSCSAASSFDRSPFPNFHVVAMAAMDHDAAAGAPSLSATVAFRAPVRGCCCYCCSCCPAFCRLFALVHPSLRPHPPRCQGS